MGKIGAADDGRVLDGRVGAALDGQASSTACFVDDRPRTAKVLRRGECAVRTPLSAADSVTRVQSEVPSPPRSDASLRSEKAAANYAATREQRRSVVARLTTATAFADALHARQIRGEDAYSNVAIGRACDVDESTVRKWRDGEKALPAWAMKLLPFEICRELGVDIETARHGKLERRELPNVRPMLSKLDAQLANEDPAIALRELVAAARMLSGMIERLTGGGA